MLISNNSFDLLQRRDNARLPAEYLTAAIILSGFLFRISFVCLASKVSELYLRQGGPISYEAVVLRDPVYA